MKGRRRVHLNLVGSASPHAVRVSSLVRSDEDVAALIEGSARDLAAQNVLYAEMTVTPYTSSQAPAAEPSTRSESAAVSLFTAGSGRARVAPSLAGPVFVQIGTFRSPRQLPRRCREPSDIRGLQSRAERSVSGVMCDMTAR